jgi:glycolate oxidase iron-sulfur subunit
MTTCPSGVNYMHLVDHARAYIEQTYRRPLPERLLRAALGWIIPRPERFRLALRAAGLARPLARLLPGQGMLAQRLRAMLALVPANLPVPDPFDQPCLYPAKVPRKARVVLLAGCAQRVLAPEINAATIRLLRQVGCEVVVSDGAGCCGSLNHHMGQHAAAMSLARANIEAWYREIDGDGLDGVVINASGCGTTVKDYGFMFRNEPEPIRSKAERIAALAVDVTEMVTRMGYAPTRPNPGLTVAYHSACSLQHGQQITNEPKMLLRKAGFRVVEPVEGHLCCGSAGTYNMLQPEIAARLRSRKLRNIAKTKPDIVAAGNIGCITQLSGDGLPVVHTVALLDWMLGGPKPDGVPEAIS